MKKFLILALICAPFLSFSQNKTPDATKSPADGKSPATEAKAPAGPKEYTPESIFGELIVFENNGRISVRMDFGRDVMQNIKDKEVLSQLELIRETPFPSSIDAINYLAASGFRLMNSFTFMNNGKAETHFLFEKRLVKAPGADNVGGMQKPPVSPQPRDPAAKPGTPAKPTDTKTDGKKKQ